MNGVKQIVAGMKGWLARLSFRTGVIVLVSCVFFYAASFAQMLLPISTGTKSVLWVVLFGLAKTAQYAGLAIVGVEGIRAIRKKLGLQRNGKI